MNLLFVHGSSRLSFDSDGQSYTDANLNEEIWDRYRCCCDKFTVLLRKEDKIYRPDEAKRRLNPYDTDKSGYAVMPDIYRSVDTFLNPGIRKEVYRAIESEVKKADKIIIRALSNEYTVTALKCARKHHKPYLVEVTGFAWEGLWNHSLRGKVIAGFVEMRYRRLMRDTPYALYVTREALQKRYPCGGKTLGCSDVDCAAASEAVMARRLERIGGQKGGRIVLGTAAALDVHFKAQWTVIRALAELKKRGIDRFEYQLIGAGTGEKLRALAEELGVSDNVRFVGLLSHDKVFDWYDGVDIYVQPSYAEGLCRSIVEAMSRACPIVSTNVGGNPELTAAENLFRPGDHEALSGILERLADSSMQEKDARYSYARSQEYDSKLLDAKRAAFLKQFMDDPGKRDT